MSETERLAVKAERLRASLGKVTECPTKLFEAATCGHLDCDPEHQLSTFMRVEKRKGAWGLNASLDGFSGFWAVPLTLLKPLGVYCRALAVMGAIESDEITGLVLPGYLRTGFEVLTRRGKPIPAAAVRLVKDKLERVVTLGALHPQGDAASNMLVELVTWGINEHSGYNRVFRLVSDAMRADRQ